MISLYTTVYVSKTYVVNEIEVCSVLFQELEHEKEKEDIRKKKAAAKRRDKRKRRKAAKDSEVSCGNQVGEDLPLENRPQELVDDYEHDQEENECDVVDTTREPCTDGLLTGTSHRETTTDKKVYLVTQDALKNRQIADDDRNKLKISASNKRPTQDTSHAKPKRPLSSTADVSTPQNSVCSNERGHRRSHSAGKESELKSHSVQDKIPRKKSEELAKVSKKKNNPVISEKVDSVKTQKIEIKTKTTSEVTQSETVNCVKPDTKHQSKAEKPVPKKEQTEKTNNSASSTRKNSHNKQQTVGNLGHVGNKSSSSKDSSHGGTAALAKVSSDTTQTSVRRIKDGQNVADNAQTSSIASDSGRSSTKGTSSSSHSPSSGKTAAPSEGEREHKPGQ